MFEGAPPMDVVLPLCAQGPPRNVGGVRRGTWGRADDPLLTCQVKCADLLQLSVGLQRAAHPANFRSVFSGGHFQSL